MYFFYLIQKSKSQPHCASLDIQEPFDSYDVNWIITCTSSYSTARLYTAWKDGGNHMRFDTKQGKRTAWLLVYVSVCAFYRVA